MKRAVLWILAGIGGLCVGAALTLVGLTVRADFRDRNPRPQDLAYIVNWSNLGAKIVEVRQVYVSRRNWLVGDQTKAYRLRLDREVRPELEEDGAPGRWRRGPISDPLLLDALTTASMLPRDMGAPWFPDPATLNSPRFLLSFFEVTAYQGQVEAVILTAYDTQERLLYHSEVKW